MQEVDWYRNGQGCAFMRSNHSWRWPESRCDSEVDRQIPSGRTRQSLLSCPDCPMRAAPEPEGIPQVACIPACALHCGPCRAEITLSQQQPALPAQGAAHAMPGTTWNRKSKRPIATEARRRDIARSSARQVLALESASAGEFPARRDAKRANTRLRPSAGQGYSGVSMNAVTTESARDAT